MQARSETKYTREVVELLGAVRRAAPRQTSAIRRKRERSNQFAEKHAALQELLQKAEVREELDTMLGKVHELIHDNGLDILETVQDVNERRKFVAAEVRVRPWGDAKRSDIEKVISVAQAARKRGINDRTEAFPKNAEALERLLDDRMQAFQRQLAEIQPLPRKEKKRRTKDILREIIWPASGIACSLADLGAVIVNPALLPVATLSVPAGFGFAATQLKVNPQAPA